MGARVTDDVGAEEANSAPEGPHRLKRVAPPGCWMRSSKAPVSVRGLDEQLCEGCSRRSG